MKANVTNLEYEKLLVACDQVPELEYSIKRINNEVFVIIG